MNKGITVNRIKKILGFETEKQCDVCALPEEILTPEQIENALSWYNKHRNHVNILVKGTTSFSPNLNEDKRDCRLWKPGHWKWFLTYYQH